MARACPHLPAVSPVRRLDREPPQHVSDAAAARNDGPGSRARGDPLRAGGVDRAETLGEFYFRDGRIVEISARFTPASLPAVQAAVGG